MYPATKLTNVADCRRVLDRIDDKNSEFYRDVFARMCFLHGTEHENPNDPMVRYCEQGLIGYEQILSEKHGRRQTAGRIRKARQHDKKTWHEVLQWQSRLKKPSDGFALLVERGLPEYTDEYVVCLFASRFEPNVVGIARNRLEEHGIVPPVSIG
jgi:hypothetical protein